MSVFAAADALFSKDECDRAIPLYEAQLQQQQESLGSFNVDNISKMSRLASCYFNSSTSSNSSTNKKEDLDKAIALNEECLMKAKLVYGDCHPSTLSTMYGLACDYATICDYVKALALHEDCFKE